MPYEEDKNMTVTISLEEFSEAGANVVEKLLTSRGPKLMPAPAAITGMLAPMLFALLAHEIFDPDDGEQAMDEVSDRDRKTAPSD